MSSGFKCIRIPKEYTIRTSLRSSLYFSLPHSDCLIHSNRCLKTRKRMIYPAGRRPRVIPFEKRLRKDTLKSSRFSSSIMNSLMRQSFCNTSLYIASSKGHDDIVRFLLDKGVDVDAVDGKQGTALQIAALEGHRVRSFLVYFTPIPRFKMQNMVNPPHGLYLLESHALARYPTHLRVDISDANCRATASSVSRYSMDMLTRKSTPGCSPSPVVETCEHQSQCKIRYPSQRSCGERS